MSSSSLKFTKKGTQGSTVELGEATKHQWWSVCVLRVHKAVVPGSAREGLHQSWLVYLWGVFVCVCVCFLCAHVCFYMCNCICMWGPEVNFMYCSLGTTHHVFDTESLTSLKLAKLAQAGWLVSPRHPSVSACPVLGLQIHTIIPRSSYVGSVGEIHALVLAWKALYQLSHLSTSHFKDLCLPWHLPVWRWTSLILFPDVTLATSKNSAFNKL